MFSKTEQHLIWYFTRIRRSSYLASNSSTTPLPDSGTRIAVGTMPDIWCVDLSVRSTMVCWLELLPSTSSTPPSEDGAETLPSRHRLLTQLELMAGRITFRPPIRVSYPTFLPGPLCGSPPPLLVGLSHLGFRPTTALEETLLLRPTLSTTQSVSSSSLTSCPWGVLNSTLLLAATKRLLGFEIFGIILFAHLGINTDTCSGHFSKFLSW